MSACTRCSNIIADLSHTGSYHTLYILSSTCGSSAGLFSPPGGFFLVVVGTKKVDSNTAPNQI